MSVPRQGFWSGMPIDMKGRLIGWVFYFLIGTVVFSQEPILGTILLLLPILWVIVRFWFLAYFHLDGFGSGRETVLTYTVRYLWRSSVYTRVAMCAIGSLAVLGGLVWISTEDMRAEAAKPTLTERAAAVAEVSKEKAGGWVATAKGWFRSDEPDTEN